MVFDGNKRLSFSGEINIYIYVCEGVYGEPTEVHFDLRDDKSEFMEKIRILETAISLKYVLKMY